MPCPKKKKKYDIYPDVTGKYQLSKRGKIGVLARGSKRDIEDLKKRFEGR